MQWQSHKVSLCNLYPGEIFQVSRGVLVFLHCISKSRPFIHIFGLSFYHLASFQRAFRINELKTEVTNRLAMLEKRVECKWCARSLDAP